MEQSNYLYPHARIKGDPLYVLFSSLSNHLPLTHTHTHTNKEVHHGRVDFALSASLCSSNADTAISLFTLDLSQLFSLIRLFHSNQSGSLMCLIYCHIYFLCHIWCWALIAGAWSIQYIRSLSWRPSSLSPQPGCLAAYLLQAMDVQHRTKNEVWVTHSY